jgi:hypothetical protein
VKAMQSHNGKLPDGPQRWKPQEHEHYFIILGNGAIENFQWTGTEFDQQAWHCGNCFKTCEHAEQARDGIKAYLAKFHNTS